MRISADPTFIPILHLIFNCSVFRSHFTSTYYYSCYYRHFTTCGCVDIALNHNPWNLVNNLPYIFYNNIYFCSKSIPILYCYLYIRAINGYIYKGCDWPLLLKHYAPRHPILCISAENLNNFVAIHCLKNPTKN